MGTIHRNRGGLRQRAEARLEACAAEPLPTDAAGMQRLIHELRVHQIELELQNQELDAAHAETQRLVNELVAHRDDLERQVDLRTEQLRKLAVRMTLVEDHERQNLAQDLHDDLGQLLYIASLKLEDLRKGARGRSRAAADELAGLVGQMIRLVRVQTAQLCPPLLADLGLVHALYWLVDDLRDNYGLEVSFDDDGKPKLLERAATVLLFRAVRELLINVKKHAGTDRARMSARVEAGRLHLAVEDDGRGIADLPAALAARHGFGLASVRERLEFLGGGMDIRTNPGKGTVVCLSVPI